MPVSTGGWIEGRQEDLPSCHSPERLDASIRVALALEQTLPRVGDLLTLPMQVAQRAGANLLRLECDALRLAQAARGPVEAVGAREELLSLLELGVGALGVVRIAVAKELAAVVCVRLELALGGVDIVLEVAEAGVVLGLEVGGDVGLLEAHLAHLQRGPVSTRRAFTTGGRGGH